MRGTGVDDLLDLCPCAFWILNNLVRPEAPDLPTLPLHCGRPASVSFDLKCVMIAVDFDHELP